MTLLVASCLLCQGLAYGEEVPVGDAPAAFENSCPDAPACAEAAVKTDADPHWIDHRHRYMSKKADELAVWMDNFFGVRRSDLESAHSRLRLRGEVQWDEEDGTGTGLKVRGKVYLPRISERLSLVFADEDLNDSDIQELDNLARDGRDDNTVALQYNLQDTASSRVDFNIGVRSGLEPKASVRYRHERPLYQKYLTRFSEEIFVRTGEGFGTVTRYDVDRAISNNRLVRLANRVKWSEETEGVDWSTRLSLSRRLEADQAISYYTFANGETRPNELTTSYGLGLLYRMNFARPWLFAEFEPVYLWRRDEPDDSRHGVMVWTVRLEIALEREEPH